MNPIFFFLKIGFEVNIFEGINDARGKRQKENNHNVSSISFSLTLSLVHTHTQEYRHTFICTTADKHRKTQARLLTHRQPPLKRTKHTHLAFRKIGGKKRRPPELDYNLKLTPQFYDPPKIAASMKTMVFSASSVESEAYISTGQYMSITLIFRHR